MTEVAFPHSPEYLARQAERQKALDLAKERRNWTDAQFLAERDAEYVAQQRGYVEPTITNIERCMLDDNDIEGYVRFYHTDEG